jgi:CheY-like chemotaxis protein
MPLVGVIEPGAVERILQSISFASADVLVLFSRDGASGQVLLEGGKIVTARLGELRDDEAVAALQQWSSGHYKLIKRGAKAEGTRGHVALNLLGTRTRRTLERALKHQGYQTSVVADPEQALQVIVYLQPDVLLTGCPRQSLGTSCVDLSVKLRQEMLLPPAIIAIEVTPQGCTEPSPPCVRAAGTVDGLVRALDREWTGTRYGVRRASLEQTAKITRPVLRRQPPGTPPSEELQAVAVAASQRAPDGLTLRDLLLALGVLLLGSAAIWTAWWSCLR